MLSSSAKAYSSSLSKDTQGLSITIALWNELQKMAVEQLTPNSSGWMHCMASSTLIWKAQSLQIVLNGNGWQSI